MEETKNTLHSKLDLFYWLTIAVLIAAGVVANYYFREMAWSLRFAVGIVLGCGLLGLAVLTSQGKRLWSFSKEARMELRKVVWPTRDETVKTTAVIAALVFAMALILWALDSILLWLVSLFTR